MHTFEECLVEKIGIGVIGIGGFAMTHLDALSRCGDDAELRAVVVPLPWNAAYNEEAREKELAARGVRIYRDYRDMIASERDRIRLVTIPVGIRFHAPMSIAALAAGYDVLCEKPVAGNVADAAEMAEAARLAGRRLAIGYQHLHTRAIQRIKRITLEGTLGRLKEARTIVLWPRDSSYYARNNWAGRLTVDGVRIYDSPVQNAAAHFLQNMLYVAGNSADSCAEPSSVYAENYHANDIDSADTQFVRVATADGARLHFVSSHAVPVLREPHTEFIYDQGRIVWEYDGSTTVFLRSTQIDSFDNGGEVSHDLPFRDMIDALRAERPPKVHIGNSIQHTRVVESAFASSGGVTAVPASEVEQSATRTGTITVIRNIVPVLEAAYESGEGFAARGTPWARGGKEILIPR